MRVMWAPHYHVPPYHTEMVYICKTSWTEMPTYYAICPLYPDHPVNTVMGAVKGHQW